MKNKEVLLQSEIKQVLTAKHELAEAKEVYDGARTVVIVKLGQGLPQEEGDLKAEVVSMDKTNVKYAEALKDMRKYLQGLGSAESVHSLNKLDELVKAYTTTGHQDNVNIKALVDGVFVAVK